MIFNRYRRLAIYFLTSILILSVSLSLLSHSKIKNNAKDQAFDLFVVSSYYYNHSKSLGDNAFAMVLTGDFDIMNKKYLTIKATNDTFHSIIVQMPLNRIVLHNKCRWTSMVSISQLIPNPTEIQLIDGNKSMIINYRLPQSNKHEVVFCTPTFYANEQWQILLLTLHVYRRYKTHMHIYIRSVMSAIMDLLRQYERMGDVTIQPWIRIELPSAESSFNPNLHIEFLNQAASQTDCLLQYKESASFIAFFDVDDLLIPRLGSTYFEEFSTLFQSAPNIAFLHYNRENVHMNTQTNASHFSIVEMFSSLQYDDITNLGKVVTRPEFLNSTRIHFPSGIPDKMQGYTVPTSINVISHLRNITRLSSLSRNMSISVPIAIFSDESTPIIQLQHILHIQNDLEKVLALPSVSSILPFLNVDTPYSHLVTSCYHQIFWTWKYYKTQDEIKCSGPERCQLPLLDINCTISTASYRSQNGNSINLHYAKQETFKYQQGCSV